MRLPGKIDELTRDILALPKKKQEAVCWLIRHYEEAARLSEAHPLSDAERTRARDAFPPARSTLARLLLDFEALHNARRLR